MPERFLLQILRSLVTHDVLLSTRGVEGGYRLKRDPKEISLLDIIEAVDGPLKPKVPTHRGFSMESRELVLSALDRVNRATRKQLRATKLSSLMLAKKRS